MKAIYVYRSSITGKFVDKEFADENPATTQRQKVMVDEKEIERVFENLSEQIKEDEKATE